MGLIISGFNVTGNLTAVHIPSSFLSSTDTYFKYNSLLLSGNGTNGAQNNTFLDSSANNFTITRNGNATQGTFSPYGSNWSNYFDGTGDYLTVGANANLSVGTSDFTIEAWVNLASGSTYQFLIGSSANGGMMVGISVPLGTPSSTIAVGTHNVAWVLDFGSAISIVSNDWTHIAITRSGSTNRAFINGVQLGSNITDSTNWAFSSNAPYIALNAGSNNFNGYISNLRVVKGTAVYTSAFTPPTAPLTAITNTSLLTCADNRLIDDSTNNLTITRNGDTSVQRFSPFSPTDAYSNTTIGGSGYFDGSGDYLTVNSGLHFGTRDFTIECWLNPAVQYADGSGISIFTGESSGSGLTWGMTFNSYAGYNGLTFSYGQYGSYTVGKYVNGYWGTKGVWSHTVFQRRSGVIQCYINGVSQTLSTYNEGGTFSDSVNISGNNTTKDIGTGYTGYISNLRVLDGTGLYSGNFTPPTEPLTAVANTSLLLNFTNAGIIDNAMMTTMETVGNAQISTTQSKFGGSSMYFDGTGDYLSSLGNPYLVLGTGDFTIECWFNVNSTTNNGLLHLAATVFPASVTGVALYVASNNISMYCAGAASPPGGAISTGVWYHVAMVRYNGVTKLYLNGTYSSGAGSVTDTTNYTGSALAVGGYYNSTLLTNGYIDDLRITKGYARYTSNFTPPTAALQTL